MISKPEDIFAPGTEGYSELQDIILNIPLISNMVSSSRRRVKDMPKDEKDRVIVDFANPHILENMEYFIEVRKVFLETGKYCPYQQSRNPNSPFRIFWDREIDRCINGLIREDGEWVSGYYYYYLNYCPILRTVKDDTVKGSKRAMRIDGFPDIWDGDYLFFHYVEKAEQLGLHGVVVKARGKGYSYKAGDMLNRNYFTIPKSKSFAFAAESEYLDSDGVLSKADDNYSFVNTNCGFSKKLALKDTLMHRISGYKKPGDSTEYGFKSERIGVTLKNNPNKARGKRGKIIIWEESGSNPNLIKAWNIALKSLEDGNLVFGFQLAFGTGGDEASNFYGLEQLFYNCKAYKVMSITNVYDKNSSKYKCGFFVPDYLNRAECYDKNGNSDVIKALGEIIQHRLDIKYSASDTSYLSKVKAEEPITPQEAFMRYQGSEFPVDELKNRLADISPSREYFLNEHYVVDLFWVSGDKVDYKPIFDKHPIREWPYKGTNLEGCVELFELPKFTKGTKEIPWGRYIGGIDPVDDDTFKTFEVSLYCVWIFDLWEDVLVAEWIGRYPIADDNHDIALKLAILYNAEMNYENKFKGVHTYFNRKNKLKYLAETPQVLKDMDYIKDNRLIGNRSYGTGATPQINAWGRKLQADWMRTVNSNRGESVIDENGNESKKGLLGVQTIRSFGYLQECISWNLDGNFDRVSAANMVFILRADRWRNIQSSKSSNYVEIDEFADDKFMRNNYTLSRSNIIGINFS